MRCKDYFRARKCFEYLLLGSDPEQSLEDSSFWLGIDGFMATAPGLLLIATGG